MGVAFTMAVCAVVLLSPLWIYRPARTAVIDPQRATCVQVIDLLAGTAIVALPMAIIQWYLRQLDAHNPPRIDWNWGSLVCFGCFVMIFGWFWWAAVVRLSRLGIETAWRRFLFEITVPMTAVLVLMLPLLAVQLVDAVQAHGWIDYRTFFRLSRFTAASGFLVLLGVLTRFALQWRVATPNRESELCPVTSDTSQPRS